jgi:acetyl-CoA synthetase
MSEVLAEAKSDTLIAVKPEIAAHALVNAARFQAMTEAARDPATFWAKECRRIDWMTPPTKILSGDFTGDVRIKWFEDGTLNATVSCLDRHLATRGGQTAILWEGDDPNTSEAITYRDLYGRVCRLANVLRGLGVKKGDPVCIYLPMVPEAAIAMLACARIGAVHTVVFGGFSPESLANRIQDAGCAVLITADEGRRGGRKVALKTNADEAVAHCPTIRHVIVVGVTGGDVPMQEGRDIDYATACAAAPATCAPEPMNAEDPLFILYTSGSTGKPKGVVHTTGGYMVWASYTHELTFDYRPGEIYWCTADVGWVTGHTYIVYGPLANGATTLMFEGIPTWPDASRFWQVVDKHQVSIFYTAPTAIRALMREGLAPVQKASRKSLRILGTVGEPINPEAWLWYYRNVGEERCPIIDTWWQTETGGTLISALPGAIAQKPGSATLPLPGVFPAILNAEGVVQEGAAEGLLCMTKPWPGMLRTIYGDHDRFIQTYFSAFKGYYFSGDGAKRDADGYYWITGRVDDVINVSGHRMGTAEVESALVAHPKVAEAAVVGFPHDLKGQAIYAYVTLLAGEEPTDDLRKELTAWVRKQIGPIAAPEVIQWAPGLPKTRSGKIMRRILRKIAANETDALGDISTLADPSVVADLVAHRVG